MSCFSLASTRSVFVSINKARDEIRCHCYNKCICDNRKNSNAFQDPVPDACSTRTVCLLQEKWEPKCLKHCIIWSSFPHCTRCFYGVFIQESLSKNKFSYWTVSPHHIKGRLDIPIDEMRPQTAPENAAECNLFWGITPESAWKSVFFCASINYII